ncbi:hypothetical protein L5515_018533 [Caenorhabditis briggsae]|uniref:Uncharacterized protein n=1 Tax=Caenorhabditis briggsae TaxID=6238 RepID=A0AAE9FJK4_CAEBR|nr:hypothetical protein L5515_018533 [Caenorhabditis briggsae]
MSATTVYFDDYYHRRASSGKLELCMSPSSSSNNIPKSQSCEEIPDINQRRRHPSLGFLEFSKTPNFRARRDAVFEPVEFQRVVVVTVPTTQIVVETSQKRKGEDSMDVDAAKKLKHG